MKVNKKVKDKLDCWYQVNGVVILFHVSIIKRRYCFGSHDQDQTDNSNLYLSASFTSFYLINWQFYEAKLLSLI